MACDSFLTTSLLQVDRVKTCYSQAYYNLFHQIVTSLQMANCNKPDFNRLVETWWNWQVWCNLLTSRNKPVKLQHVCGVYVSLLTLQSKAVSLILTYILALNGGARPTTSQLIQHPFFTDENYLDIMNKTAPHDEITPEETGEKNTTPDEITLPAEDTPTEENTLSEESSLSEVNTQPGVSTPLEVNTEPEESSLSEDSAPPAASTVPEERAPLDESLDTGAQPLPANKSMVATIVPDEMPSMEEALPVEYSQTQRKPLLPENDLKIPETPNNDCDESVAQGNTLQNGN